MDPSHYKDVKVHGVQYHYYRISPSSPGNPNLLFLHGFPSTSEHWVHQVSYFSNKGYGIIALDMLGYGGTDKPDDPKAYNMSTLAQHCVAILDAEDVEKAVVIGHDWGTSVTSRVANLYPERHLASVFLTGGYILPYPDVSGEGFIEYVKQTIGRDLFSYWKFFSTPEAPKILATHEDSFYSIMFTSEPLFWSKNFSPEGELEKFLLSDKRAPTESWAPDRKRHNDVFRAGGWMAPTNWYRCGMAHRMDVDKAIPKDSYNIHHPVLLVTALRDAICLSDGAKQATAQFAPNLVIRDLDAGHWIMFEKPDELNAILSEFLQGLKA